VDQHGVNYLSKEGEQRRTPFCNSHASLHDYNVVILDAKLNRFDVFLIFFGCCEQLLWVRVWVEPGRSGTPEIPGLKLLRKSQTAGVKQSCEDGTIKFARADDSDDEIG
jgi:hypothetical protein